MEQCKQIGGGASGFATCCSLTKWISVSTYPFLNHLNFELVQITLLRNRTEVRK